MIKSRKIVLSAMLIAIATILSFIQPFRLPFGGGITLASMMPVIILSFIFGTKWGIFSAFVYSILQLVIGIKDVSAFFLPGESQMNLVAALLVCITDYIIAYTLLGFGGIFRERIKNDIVAVTAGTALAIMLRYVTHIISGTIFFGTWAEWFFNQDGFYAVGKKIIENFSGISLSLIYSVFYNGLYMIPELIITTAITPAIYKILKRSNSI